MMAQLVGFLCLFVSIRAQINPQESIAVIGAGAAGLSAATKLISQGYLNVVVYEAKARAGGRVNTQIIAGNAVDIGAFFLHGTYDNSVYDNATLWNIPLIPFGANQNSLIDQRALQTLSLQQGFQLETVYEYAKSRLRSYQADSSFPDTSLEQAFIAIVSDLNLAPPVDAWLQFKFDAAIREVYHAESSQLSFREYDAGRPLIGGDSVIPSTWSLLVDRWAFNVPIQYNMPVSVIDWSSVASGSPNSSISVLFSSGKTVSFNRVIVTVSAGVLQAGSLKFSPQLPPSSLDALSYLKMGSQVKVVLVFKEPFWPSSNSLLYLINKFEVSNTSNPWCSFVSLLPYTNQSVLIASSSGDYALSLERRSESSVVAEVMRVLRQSFPLAPNPEAAGMTLWSSDIYSRGSIAARRPGWSPSSMIPPLISPLGQQRLVFAGEHLSQSYPGTVQGAIESGADAVNFMESGVLPPAYARFAKTSGAEKMTVCLAFFAAILLFY